MSDGVILSVSGKYVEWGDSSSHCRQGGLPGRHRWRVRGAGRAAYSQNRSSSKDLEEINSNREWLRLISVIGASFSNGEPAFIRAWATPSKNAFLTWELVCILGYSVLNLCQKWLKKKNPPPTKPRMLPGFCLTSRSSLLLLSGQWDPGTFLCVCSTLCGSARFPHDKYTFENIDLLLPFVKLKKANLCPVFSDLNFATWPFDLWKGCEVFPAALEGLPQRTEAVMVAATWALPSRRPSHDCVCVPHM